MYPAVQNSQKRVVEETEEALKKAAPWQNFGFSVSGFGSRVRVI